MHCISTQLADTVNQSTDLEVLPTGAAGQALDNHAVSGVPHVDLHERDDMFSFRQKDATRESWWTSSIA